MQVRRDNLQIFKGKKVFLTGHTGFKGTWFLWMLRELGANVKGYALAPESEPSLFSLTRADEICNSVIADVRDAQRLSHEIAEFQPDVVFHFAAQALVIDSYRAPIDTYATNVMGTAHLLQALAGIKKPCSTVIITTDKVYENIEQHYAYNENDHLGGYDPYSSSKACCEILVSSWRRSFFPTAKLCEHKQSIATARSGNVIGGGDFSENRIIPDLIRALESGISLAVRHPGAVRPWQHVLDPLYGYLRLAAQLLIHPEKHGEAYNFGPHSGDTLTVEQLVEKAIKIWGGGQWHNAEDPNSVHEAGLLMLDTHKARTELGWTPSYNATTSVSDTISWYKESKGKEATYTLAQIKSYLDR
ncbi:MAG: CDP-glucose 4,6-dehydratase [Flavobacteriales bacterium]|nr:CDP-glucose 4,6-dehydratase [Flavobacteriales bacterium]